jgi:hypothetical protein
MLQNNLQQRFSQLPDEFKIEVLDFIEFLHTKSKKSNIDYINFTNEAPKQVIENIEINKRRKKVTAVELLAVSKNKRNKILKEQALIAKKIYNQNPDLIIPDFCDDIMEA